MLAEAVKGLTIVVGGNRFEAGKLALAELDPQPDLFLLDDGFSHVYLHRDLDLLTFPAADPWAGGRLPPAGRLREPLESARWADAVLLTGCGEAPAGNALAERLRPFGFSGPGFAVATRAEERAAEGTVALAGRPVLLVTAIARPERVADSARDRGAELRDHLRLRDHHDYPEATLEEIRRRFRQCGAQAVVTTTKDLVKLRGRLDLPLIELRITAEPQPDFWTWLDQSLSTAESGSISNSASPLSTD